MLFLILIFSIAIICFLRFSIQLFLSLLRHCNNPAFSCRSSKSYHNDIQYVDAPRRPPKRKYCVHARRRQTGPDVSPLSCEDEATARAESFAALAHPTRWCSHLSHPRSRHTAKHMQANVFVLHVQPGEPAELRHNVPRCGAKRRKHRTYTWRHKPHTTAAAVLFVTYRAGVQPRSQP